jgi:hypothetical protein
MIVVRLWSRSCPHRSVVPRQDSFVGKLVAPSAAIFFVPMALSVYVMMISNGYNSPPKSVFSSKGIITLYALEWLALEVNTIAVAI